MARKYTQQIGTADGEQVGRKRKENASFIDAGVQEASTAEVQLAAYPINTGALPGRPNLSHSSSCQFVLL